MSNTVKPIPDGHTALTPYLIVDGAAGAIEFYRKVFGAIELFRMADPKGRIGHAELMINDSRLMLADEFPTMGGAAHCRSAVRPCGCCCMLTTSMPPSLSRSPRVRSSYARSRISSTAIEPAGSKIPSVTTGTSPHISKTCRPKK